MIEIKGNIIEMHTKSTSYILYTGHGLAENLYYGGRIKVCGEQPLLPKVQAGFGGDVLQKAGQPALSSLFLELSPNNRGDYRRPALLARMPHGGTTTAFEFKTSAVLNGPAPSGGMPSGRKPDKVLSLSFSEAGGLEAELFYSIFYDSDVITKKMRVTNRGKAPLSLLRCLSSQLDLPRCDFDLHTFTGTWAREFTQTKQALNTGINQFGNGTGASGHRCNPFFMLAQSDATETCGEVYGFNLIYSGSHEGSAEVDSFGRTRIMQGVWSDGFEWPLAPGESFITPEAVLTYSAEGMGKMSDNMHSFVRRHILPPHWANAPRPVLVNNWEGTYFNFNESKIVSMAKVAAKLGAELFVLDDGWFGTRNTDTAGLGDYNVNHKKLPGGINGLCKKINALGLDFGLWFEPEMVNEDSDLYRAHPDWAVQTPGHTPATGRNQLVLDLCRPEVREYIIENVGKVLDSANIKYVKWDMNRHISDNYSAALENQGQFSHKYILGLYEVLTAICATRPDILFEGCASGGNRFDLGILYYMPQIWLSDDTDAHQRQKIQTGASFGYPQCTMGCHVSAVPNHQTLRSTPLETRFNTAIFGLLGYELDMTTLTRAQKSDVAKQIEYYKEHRRLLQYGRFARLKNPFFEDGCRWQVTAPSKKQALAGDFIALLMPNSINRPMRLTALDEEKVYNIEVRPQKIDIETFGGLINYVLPMHLNPDGALVKAANKLYRMDSEEESYTAYGSLLCRAGLVRKQNFSGAGYGEDLRFMADFFSRVYYIKQEDTAAPLNPNKKDPEQQKPQEDTF